MMAERQVGAGIGIMVVRDGMVLLGKRHDDPEKASSALHGEGTWTMPGGKLHFGETFHEGGQRELREETGMDAASFTVISVSNDMVEDAHFVTIGLLCTAWKGEPRVMEPDEITEWEWFPISRPPQPLFFPCEKILKSYREKKVYAEEP